MCHYWSKSGGAYFKQKQLQQYVITVCSVIICLLTWALDVVFSFEIHANSKNSFWFLSAIYYQLVSTWNTNIITRHTLLCSQHANAPQFTPTTDKTIIHPQKPHSDPNLRDVEATHESIRTPDSSQGHTIFMCCHDCHEGYRLMVCG